MPTLPLELRLDEPGAAVPFLDQPSDRFRMNGRMISRRNQHGVRHVWEGIDAEHNRSAHFTVGIRIGDERYGSRTKLLAHRFSAMSKNDDDLSDSRGAKIVNARFNYRLVAKGKERFEFTHPARTAGGENDCGDSDFGLWTLVFDFGYQSSMSADLRPKTLVAHIVERADCVLTRHLLAPLIDKICVIQWPGLYIGGFGGGFDLIVAERLAD